MSIESWDPERDGPLSERSLQHKLERRGYSCSAYVYPPGTRFPPHSHSVDKIDAVLEGRFRISMAGRDYVLGPGDALFVPRGEQHSAEVLGATPVTSIDAVKS